MAITTLDGVIAGMRPPVQIAKAVTATLVAGRPASLWSLGGTPGAGSFDSTINGATLSSSSVVPNGALRHTDPASGNSYLARLQASATQGGVLLLLDRLWQNQLTSMTATTPQYIVSPTWPSRCPTSGTDDTPSSNGLGVMLALEISVATGAGTPTITVTYLNETGAGSPTSVATNIIPTVASSAIGATYFLSLAPGDLGVRSVQSVTLSGTWTQGTGNLVAYRLLAALELTGAFLPNAIDALTSGMPRLYNGVVPWLVFVPNTTTASNVFGSYVETQG